MNILLVEYKYFSSRGVLIFFVGDNKIKCNEWEEGLSVRGRLRKFFGFKYI